MKRGEPYHTFLDGLAMVLGELQAGNPSEALAPLAGPGSKLGVRWGPSSYSQTPIHIFDQDRWLVASIRDKP
jgi:hypothetical protein